MTHHRRLAHYGTVSGLLVAVWSTGCSTPPPQVTRIDERADPILRQMCDTLDKAGTFRFQVNATMDQPVETGQLAQFHRISEITVARPNKLYATTQSDNGQWVVWYRGKALTILDAQANLYATESVPEKMDDMLDYLADEYDLVIPMADLLIGETYASLVADVESGTYLGLHTVEDTPCHHLLFLQENLDWQIWIDAGEKALPRKLVITHTQDSDQPQYIATMDGWDLAPVLSAETFTFVPPVGAQSVTMTELMEEE